MYGFLCLASFTYHDVFKVHVIVCQYFIPFLWLNNISLYEHSPYLLQYLSLIPGFTMELIRCILFYSVYKSDKFNKVFSTMMVF